MRQSYISSTGGLTLQPPQPPRPKPQLPLPHPYGKGHQLHLGGVSGAHHSQIHGALDNRSKSSRKKNLKSQPTMAILESFHHSFGVNAYDEVQAKTKKKLKSKKTQSLPEKERTKIFNAHWRQKGTAYHPGHGSTGQDETLSTSSARKIIETLEPSKPNDLGDLVGRLSQHRSETSQLAWPIEKPQDPIGGHPGSMSKVQSDMRKGITTKHNTKDTDRAALVMHQFQQSFNKKKDPKKAVNDAVLMARLDSQKSFRTSYQELSNIDFSRSNKDRSNVYSARYGQVVKNRKKTDNFGHMARDLHNSREREKWDLALNLLKNGQHNLVPPIYHKHLTDSRGDVGAAMGAFLESNPGPAPPISMSSSLPKASKKQPLQTLEELSNQYGQQPNLKHPMSPPRLPIKPQPIAPQNPKSSSSSKQPKIDSYFTL
ncbi:MAG: hypothetical protein AAGM22_30440 [Acidobacteriota bacterium]